MKYLAVVRPPRIPQTQPMSVGSAFDAYVKSYLHKSIFGASGDWTFEKLFKDQVEKQNRDFARASGLEVWEFYKSTGCLQDLLIALEKASDIKFETRMDKWVEFDRSGVPIVGVPDLLFTAGDVQVILDWKVNGYCSKRKTSPKKGYVDLYPDRIHHKDVWPIEHYGIKCLSSWFNDFYNQWALQLTTYSWLLGCPLNNRTLCQIHQVAWPGRIAIHSGLIEPKYQENLFNDYVDLWNRIKTRDLGLDIEKLNGIASTMLGDSNEQQLYRELVR